MHYQFGKYAGLRGLANDSATKLLLHMDGANGSTTITDSSSSGHLPVLSSGSGTIELRTAVKKFGSASLYMDSNGTEKCTIPDSSDFAVSSNNFTIDFWLRYVSGTLSNNFVFDQFVDNDNYLRLLNNGDYLQFFVRVSAVNEVSLSYDWSSIRSADTWYHIAVLRGWNGNANDWAMTIDGTAVDTDTVNYSVPDFAADLKFGGGNIEGYFDEVRFSNGAARWIQDFIPPAGTS